MSNCRAESLGSAPASLALHCTQLGLSSSVMAMATPNTLFIFICRNGQLQQARLTLEAGADPNSMVDGWTCLTAAVMYDHSEVVSLLLSHPNINPNAKSGLLEVSALHVACYRGSMDSLNLLLGVPGLELNERDTGGDTPLMIAASFGRSEAVRALTQKPGLDLDLKTPRGETIEELVGR